MIKIIQLQKFRGSDDVISVCVSDIQGKNKSVFNCRIEHLSDIVRLNLD